MVQYSRLNLSDVVFIGHSLGSHIVGLAAKRIRSGRIPIIVALDPAYPLFSKSKHEERLARTDADYVQVIHTSTGQLSIPYPIGHADFYPNYGSNQSGCSRNTYQGRVNFGVVSSHKFWLSFYVLNRFLFTQSCTPFVPRKFAAKLFLGHKMWFIRRNKKQKLYIVWSRCYYGWWGWSVAESHGRNLLFTNTFRTTVWNELLGNGISSIMATHLSLVCSSQFV